MNHRNSFQRLLGLSAGVLLAASAAARPDSQPANPPADNPLGGPKVEDRAVPGSNPTFGDGKNADNKARQRPLPHPLFMRAVRSLNDDETPDELRLSDDQEIRIRAIAEEFQTEQRAFRDAHQDEIRKLRAEAGIRGGPDGPGGPGGGGRGGRGGPPPDGAPGEPGQRGKRGPGGPDDDAMGDQKPGPEAAEAREKLKALMAQAPKPDACHTKIWAVLSEQQQGALKDRLEAARRDMEDRMMDGPQRRGGPGGPDGQGKGKGRRGDNPPPPPPPPPGSGRDQGAFRGPPPRFPGGPGGPDRFAGPRGDWRRHDRDRDMRAQGFRPDDHMRMPPPPPGGDDDGPRARRGPGGPDAPDGPGPQGPVTIDDLRDRLDRLPPEARDRVLRRMINLLDNAQDRMPHRRGPQPPPPPAEMDEPGAPRVD